MALNYPLTFGFLRSLWSRHCLSDSEVTMVRVGCYNKWSALGNIYEGWSPI